MNDAKAKMTDFLRVLDQYHRMINHCGLPAMLLAGGLWFEGRTGSDSYESAKQWKKRNRPKTQECYYNAQFFCLEHEDSRYFEGYAMCMPHFGPAEHAWVVMPDGKVVDFTFEQLERRVKREKLSLATTTSLYLGLEVSTQFIRQTMPERKFVESLAEEYFGSQIPGCRPESSND